MTIQRVSSQHLFPMHQWVQIYKFLDIPSACALARTDIALQDIFKSQIHNFITIPQFGLCKRPLSSSEQYQRIVLANTRNPGILCDWTLEHKKLVSSIQISADGTKALSGSYGGTLKMWDLDTGECIKTINGHARTIHRLQMNADGTRALSGSKYMNLKLWDLDTGECLKTIDGHEDKVTCIRMNREETKVLVGFESPALQIWDLKTGTCIKTLQGNGHPVSCIEISEDWTTAVSGSRDKTLKVWDLATGECLKAMQGHKAVTRVQMNREGTKALVGFWSRSLRLWDLETGECEKSLRGHTEWITCMRMSADGTRALSGSNDKSLKMWDLETGECIKTLQGHTDGITSLQMSSDATRAISGSRDMKLKIWDLQTGECLRTLQEHKGDVYRVQVSKDGTKALSSSVDCTMKVWNLTPLPEEYVIAVAKAYQQKSPTAETLLQQLPSSVQQALLHMECSKERHIQAEDESKNSEDHHHLTQGHPLSDRTFNRYLTQEFLPTIAKLFQKSVLNPPSLCNDSAYRRFTKFPDAVKDAVYRQLGKNKGLLSRLDELSLYNLGELSFHNRGGHSATHQERADAIRNAVENVNPNNLKS